MTTVRIDPNELEQAKALALQKVAQRYLDAAYSSIVGRTVRATRDSRYESRGLLLALETILGMSEALRLIEREHEAGRQRGMSIDSLLYDFWRLDKPESAEVPAGLK